MYRTSMWSAALLATLAVCAAGCTPSESAPAAARATGVYNKTTGRLEQLVSDRDGDGHVDTRAFMDGKRPLRIEIDRDNDGRVDRWERYAGVPPQIVQVDEANGEGDRVTRREFYERGQLRRVEADADGDGRVDRWEWYEGGLLADIDVDSNGDGRADRRFVYRRDGSVERTDVDQHGDGTWVPMPPPSEARTSR